MEKKKKILFLFSRFRLSYDNNTTTQDYLSEENKEGEGFTKEEKNFTKKGKELQKEEILTILLEKFDSILFGKNCIGLLGKKSYWSLVKKIGRQNG